MNPSPDATPNTPRDVTNETRKPYAAPELADYGSLEQHTQANPFGGGGADAGSS